MIYAGYPDGMICKFQPLINRNYKDYSAVMQNLTKYLTMTKKAAQEKVSSVRSVTGLLQI